MSPTFPDLFRPFQKPLALERRFDFPLVVLKNKFLAQAVCETVPVHFSNNTDGVFLGLDGLPRAI